MGVFVVYFLKTSPPYYACKAGEPVNCQITHTQQPFSSHQKLVYNQRILTLEKKMLSRYVKLYEDFAWSVEWKPCVTLLPWWHTETVCWWQQTTPTPLPLLKPDVMHNYTFFMPSSETWEKAFFVPINHLVVINDKSGHFPLYFMNDENQLGTVVWKLVMCLRFITRVILPSFRSDLIFYLAKKIKFIPKQNLFSGSRIVKNH